MISLPMTSPEAPPDTVVPCIDIFLVPLAVVTVIKVYGWDADGNRDRFISVSPWQLIMQFCVLEGVGFILAA